MCVYVVCMLTQMKAHVLSHIFSLCKMIFPYLTPSAFSFLSSFFLIRVLKNCSITNYYPIILAFSAIIKYPPFNKHSVMVGNHDTIAMTQSWKSGQQGTSWTKYIPEHILPYLKISFLKGFCDKSFVRSQHLLTKLLQFLFIFLFGRE